MLFHKSLSSNPWSWLQPHLKQEMEYQNDENVEIISNCEVKKDICFVTLMKIFHAYFSNSGVW